MRTWYMIDWGYKVTPVKVERALKATLILASGRRVLKVSKMGRFFRTENEAWKHLIENAQGQVRAAQIELEDAFAMLKKLKEEHG